MAIFNIQYAKVALTANGSGNGLLSVTDTTNLVEKALVYLASNSQPIKTLMIDKIVSNTDLYVKEVVGYVYSRFNASAYTVADGATLTQPPAVLDDYVSALQEVSIIANGSPLGLANTINFLGAVNVSLTGNKANVIVTNSGPGSTYPIVDTYNDLPITLGSPAIDTIYVVKQSSGVWLLNRKVRGLWIRTGNAGALTDWSRLGDWLEAFSDNNFQIYDNIDNSKQMMFDVGSLSPGTTRTYVAPNKNGTLALLSDVLVNVAKAGTVIGSRPTVNLIEGSNVTLTVADNSVDNRVDITIAAAGGGGGGSGVAIAAGTQTATTGTVQFSNSNGITFGLSNGTLTASHNGITSQSVQTQNMVSVFGSTGNVSFANGNGITFGGNASTITASHNGITTQTVQTQNLVSVQGSTGNISFANGNGVTFGFNNSTVTASHNGLTSQSNQALSGSNGSFVFQTATFGNLNGLSFYTSNGSMVGSYTVPNVPAQTVQTQNMVSVQGSTGNVSFSNSNGITFGFNNSTITASHNGITTQTVQTQGSVQVQGSTGAISFANGNGVTFGGNISTVTASVGAGATATGNFGALAAGTQTATSGTVAFVNSNGISFGMSGSNQITASYTVPNVPAQTQQPMYYSASGSSTSANTLAFGNSNGVSFSLSNGSVIGTVKTDYLTNQSVQTQNTVSVLGSTGNISFANGNGVTFGANASTITASVASQTNQTIGGYAVGNTTGQSSNSTFDARTLSVSGAGIISVGYSAGNLLISASAAGAGDGGNILAAGTQTANTTGTVAFVNSNGISFGMSNNSQITASYTVPNVPAQTVQTQNMVSIQGSTGAISLANSNGVTFGFNNSTITASHNGLTSQSNQALSGSNGSFTFQTATFGNLNGLSFYTSNGSLVGSYTVPSVPAQTNQTIGGYAVGNTTGQSSNSTFDARTLSISGAGNVSVGYSGGAIIISATGGGGGGGGIAAAAGTQTQTSGTLAFVNSNGITFGMSNSSQVTASYALSDLAAGANISLSSAGSVISVIGNNPLAVTAGTNSRSTGTVQFSNLNGISFGMSTNGILTASHNGLTLQSNQVLSVYGVGNSTQSSSGTINASALSFNGAGIASVGVTNGSVIISVPAGGGGGDGVNILAAGTQTANTTGTVLFQNGNGVTFGMSNNSVITASVNAGGGGGATLSYFNPNDKALQVVTHQGNGTLHMQPVQMPNVTYDRLVFPVYISNSSNSTGTMSYSQIFGIYTRTGSTLSLFDSVSTSGTINNSGTVNASINNGIRLITVANTGFLSEGQYYMAVINRTTTAGANATFSQVAVSQLNSNFSGILGAANNATIQYTRGLGVYTATTTVMPNSIAFSQLSGSNSIVLRVPIFYFVSQTF